MVYDKARWRASVLNGQIPRDKLEQIYPVQFDPDLQGPALMHPEAAEAMSDFLYAARVAGHTDLRVKYSYRTYAKQEEKYANYQAGGNLAAFPGTSNHGWAVTVDFTWSSPRSIEWAHRNAAKFGFKFDVPSENWHCTYQGGYKGDDVKFDEFEKGVRAFWRGDPEPQDAGPKRFGWNFARDARTRPAPIPGPKGEKGDRGEPGEPAPLDHPHTGTVVVR